MKNLEIPLGDYKFAQVTMNQYVHVDGKVICNVVKRFKKETEAIGILIADACNTYQRTGLLPSELEVKIETLKTNTKIELASTMEGLLRAMKETDELRDALKELMEGVRGLPPLTVIAGALSKQYEKAEQALKSRTN